MKRLQEKIAIITGASGGIGRQVARRFLDEGASVVLVDIDQVALEATAAELGAGDRLLTVRADVSSDEDVERYVKATVGRFGRIDVFFNNAGIEGKVAPLEQQELAMFDKVIAVNVRGAYLGLRHVLPHMYAAGKGADTGGVSGLERRRPPAYLGGSAMGCVPSASRPIFRYSSCCFVPGGAA